MSDLTRSGVLSCPALALLVFVATALVATGRIAIAQTPQPSAQDRVAALNSLLADSQAALRHYEWIETTIVTLHGQVRSRKQERCYYGPDGAFKKTDVYSSHRPTTESRDAPPIDAQPKNFSTSVRSALSLVKSYIPLRPTDMQAARGAGRVRVVVLQSGKRLRVNVLDYHKIGDEVGIEIDLAKNKILRVTVTTYLNDITDVVTLNVTMGQLSDGSAYPAGVMLEEPTRALNVAVQDTGYRIPY